MADHEHDHDLDEPGLAEDEQAVEREARRLIALSRIRQYGDSVLRMKAREVESFDDDLGRLVERMTELMHEASGVGLAATQVGVLRRVFVFVDDGEDRVLVNPTITKTSKETDVDDEGCLSLREVLVPVERRRRSRSRASTRRVSPCRSSSSRRRPASFSMSSITWTAS